VSAGDRTDTLHASSGMGATHVSCRVSRRGFTPEVPERDNKRSENENEMKYHSLFLSFIDQIEFGGGYQHY